MTVRHCDTQLRHHPLTHPLTCPLSRFVPGVTHSTLRHHHKTAGQSTCVTASPTEGVHVTHPPTWRAAAARDVDRQEEDRQNPGDRSAAVVLEAAWETGARHRAAGASTTRREPASPTELERHPAWSGWGIGASVLVTGTCRQICTLLGQALHLVFARGVDKAPGAEGLLTCGYPVLTTPVNGSYVGSPRGGPQFNVVPALRRAGSAAARPLASAGDQADDVGGPPAGDEPSFPLTPDVNPGVRLSTKGSLALLLVTTSRYRVGFS
jgi:hypothetical protein